MRSEYPSGTFNFRLQIIITSLLLALLPLTTIAADRNNETEPLESLLSLDLEQLMRIEIRTASRSIEKVVDAPARVVVITRQEIEERGYINLFDLLRDTAGIDTHQYSHETTYNRVAIRGVVGNNKFLIQQDGVPIGSPAGDPIPIADNFPLFNAERVEIVFGPGSALYGADAFTGVINIITDTDSIDETKVGSYFGEDNYRYLYSQSNYQLSDKVRFNFAAHVQDSDNPDLSKYYPENFALNDLVDFGGNTVVTAGQREGYFGETNSHSLSFSLDVGDDFTLGYHQSLFKSPTTTGLNTDNIDYASKATWSSLVGNVFSKYETDIDSTTSARILFNYSFYEVNPASKFNNLFSNYVDGYKYARSDKIQLDGQLNFELNEDNKIVVGGVVENISSLAKTADLIVPYDPDSTSEEQTLFYGGTNNTLPVKIYNTSYTNIGVFFQHRKSWSDSFDSILGVRYDENSRYGHSTNPRLGFIHQPNQRLTTKLLYGKAFLAPAPEFTYEHFGSFDGTTNAQGDYLSAFFFIPNADLQPEEIQTLEVNLSYLVTKDLLLAMSIYHSEVNNLILNATNTVPESDFINGGVIAATSHNDNVGDLKVDGLDINFSHNSVFKNASLKTWGSYTYTEGTMRDTVRNLHVDLPFVARNKLKLGATYRYHKKYYLTPLVYWIDDTSTDVPDLSPTSTTSKSSAGYTLIDLKAGVNEIIPGLSLSLKINNLLDRRYYNAGTGVNITLAESPQNPRQFIVGLAYVF